MVYGAVFDSYMDQHDSGCLPGTRTDILHQISEWAISPQGRCIFWLNGMAGTGKSTIARTVAKSFSQTKSLGASFFFKRGEGDRGNAMKLIPTIAMQLASIPKLLTYIQQAVCEDPAIAAKGMTDQFKKLLLQPLLSLKPCDLSIRTVLIVIDALDECDDNDEIRLILQLLPQLQKSSTVRLRVFLTSRPELPLRLGIKKLANHEHKDLILHEISEEVVRRDISLFLNHRLSEIRAEREPPLPMDWPGGTNFQKLVTLSVPLFIFAATICRIFKDPDWDPIDSLTEIVTQRNDESRLGRIYLPVLHRLLNRKSEKQKKQLVQEFHQVVGAIVILKSPLSVISLSRLLGLPERLVYLRLNALHSVLRVPNDETLPVQLFHLSFREFLLDPATCEISPFWVNNKEIHLNLTARCLLTCQKLRKNMCELPSDGAESSKNASQTVDHYLPPELQYACRYWAHHLVQCTDLDDVIRDTLFFLQRHFLHWVEAMILLGLAGEVEGIIDLFQSVALVNVSVFLIHMRSTLTDIV
jgi:type II secretory pathway predicted ATPase ExeA